MKITKNFLTPNPYSRPQNPIRELRGIVMHYTANVRAGALANRNYFDSLKNQCGKNAVYASAHYVVGQGGDIVQCVPEGEVAYHCGTKRKDPASGRVYTDYARAKFGKCFTSEDYSPNFCTIGVEMCNCTEDGKFTDETVNAAAELCADICRRTGLKPHDITTHHDVVGWKACPLLWTKRPELLAAFREKVAELLGGGNG